MMSVPNMFDSGDPPMPDLERPAPCAAWAEALALRAAGALSDEAATALELHLASCPGCTQLAAEFDGLADRLRRAVITETAERPILTELSHGDVWRSLSTPSVVDRPSARSSSRRPARYAALLAALVVWGIVAWWGGRSATAPKGVVPVEIVQTGSPSTYAAPSNSAMTAASVPREKPASTPSSPTWGDYSLALARSDKALDDLLAASASGRPMDQSTFPVTPRSTLEDLWQ
jgi:hypothetical protein